VQIDHVSPHRGAERSQPRATTPSGLHAEDDNGSSGRQNKSDHPRTSTMSSSFLDLGKVEDPIYQEIPVVLEVDSFSPHLEYTPRTPAVCHTPSNIPSQPPRSAVAAREAFWQEQGRSAEPPSTSGWL